MNITKPPLVLIAGPTASGKSALAMTLADLTPATIINADSMQVYRDLRIVTARPSVEDEARHPHRLFGTIDGAEACSAARWARDARAAIDTAHGQARLPILVGGTGLYIRTLLDGIAPVPEIDPAVRAVVRALPVIEAHEALARADPLAAARLSRGDTTRVARALEVVRSTGQPLGVWQQQRVGGIAGSVRLVPMILLPPREDLFAHIDTRFEAIFERGQCEVAMLAARALDPILPIMRAIGVREITAHLAGELSAYDAIVAGQMATRQYAKRQLTWFRRQSSPNWPTSGQLLNTAKTVDLAIMLRITALTS